MQNKTELAEQQAVMEWAEYQTGRYPELKLLYHIPNEGKRSVVNGANLKRAGLKKGVPDLCLPVAKGYYNSLYIEMKKNRKCRPSADQIEWQIGLNAEGNLAVVCYSADEAIQTIKDYLNERINKNDL